MDRELRRLLFFVAGVLVVLFTGRAVVSSLWDADAAARQAAAFRARLAAGGEADARPDRAELTRLARLRGELSERLQGAVERTDYRLPDDFAVRPGESADLRYIEIVRREQERLVKGAAFVGKAVPSNLGLPELNPTGLQDVLRALRALHMVHLVVTAALAADVDSVDEIRVPAAARRPRVEAGFLRSHEVEFEVRGTPPSVAAMLEAIVTGDPYLALDEVRIERTDEDGERVVARFTARALVIDEGLAPGGPQG